MTACYSPDQATQAHPQQGAPYTNAVSAKDTTLTGQDTDGNRIRDDVQADIAASYPVPQQASVFTMARTFQDFLVSAQDDTSDNS